MQVKVGKFLIIFGDKADKDTDNKEGECGLYGMIIK